MWMIEINNHLNGTYNHKIDIDWCICIEFYVRATFIASFFT